MKESVTSCIKRVGGTDVTGAQALQAVDYSYNIRGWLKAINDVNTLGTDLFAFKINYNQKENGTAGLFNGNITETLWRTSADNIKRKYNYSYDNLNRLLQANYSKPDASTNLNNYKEWLNYDANGNITDIVRTGFIDPVAGTVENVIDNLKFVYDTASQNRLLKVNDLSNSPQGFKDNYASTANDFTYDNNGNMTADNNKGIVSIIYNHLNLPIKLNFGAKGEITYLYNAAGQKLQKFVKDIVSNTNTTTDYLSGFQYLNTTLQFFPHAEGYMHYTKPLSNGQLGSFNYVFNYTDHLGNVRVSFAKDPQQGNVLKILEENHYYAFGMKHENYNVTRVDFKRYPDTGVELVPLPAVANASYNYKYNGKELQEELGLNMTAMDFRQYDNAIGRFVGIDVLAESSSSVTPYHFGNNNPVFWADPSGLVSQSFIDRMLNSASGTTWTNNGVGFSSGNQHIDNDGYETLPPIFIQGSKSRITGNFLGFKSDNLVGGFNYGLAEKARDQAYQFGSAYQSRRDAIASRQIDEFQSFLDGVGTGDPTGFADALNAIIYGFRGQWRYAGISAIAIIPYAGDFAKGGKYLGKIDNYAKLADDVGTRAYIKEFNNTSVVNTRILFNDITQGGTKKIINTPNGSIIKATMQDGSMIQLRNFSTKSGDLNHSTIQFIGSQEKWKFNH